LKQSLVLLQRSVEHRNKLQSPRPILPGAGFVSFIPLLATHADLRDRSYEKLSRRVDHGENDTSLGTRPERQWCFEPDC
jgi:hypothetical protein